MGKASKILKNIQNKVKKRELQDLLFKNDIKNMVDDRSYQLSSSKNNLYLGGAFLTGMVWKQYFKQILD